MAFALPVWLALHEELLAHGAPDSADPLDDFDDDALFQAFHLTRPCIAFVADAVRVRMKNNAAFRSPAAAAAAAVSVDAAVLVALNYYAHGASSADVLQRVGRGRLADPPALICGVSEVVAGMADQFISFPLLRDAKLHVASQIKEACGIPHAIGVLAPAHFRIRAPLTRRSQVICDSEGNVLSVEKCCVGGTCEQEMWETSFKGREMEEELHGPYWVIGKGYHLSKHVMTPVSEPANDNEVRFNEAHAKIHDVMRTTLGSMKRRFRCLMQLGFAQECSLDKKADVIKACSVLHNIAKKFSVPAPPAAGKIEPLHPGNQNSVPFNIDPEALQARQELIQRNFSVGSASKDPPSNAGENL
uniref:DDE Tnp4 domain-containing protein n=1 Tax=Gasterosteus aculeatus aculeatus TaxID=481459 RepID=G3NZ95_GASAC